MEIEPLMQAFVYDKDNRGIDFARERLHQKYSYLNLDKNQLRARKLYARLEERDQSNHN